MEKVSRTPPSRSVLISSALLKRPLSITYSECLRYHARTPDQVSAICQRSRHSSRSLLGLHLAMPCDTPVFW
jgi:hypothetical protein